MLGHLLDPVQESRIDAANVIGPEMTAERVVIIESIYLRHESGCEVQAALAGGIVAVSKITRFIKDEWIGRAP